MVEVRYHPWYRELHGEKFAHQALQILSDDVELRGRNGDQLG